MSNDAFGVASDLVGAKRVAPDAAVAVAVRVHDRWKVESAYVCSDGLGEEPIFDLASLTKPMTAIAIAISGLVKDFVVGGAPLELLLAHRAGLEAHVRLRDPDTALDVAANARRIDCQGPVPAAGFPRVYSDLGYIVAGAALARAVGVEDAGAAVEQLVGGDLELGTARSFVRRDVRFGDRVRKTEGEIRGRVHDENAWLLTGAGGSGHAGMFGTAPAVAAFGCAVLDALEGRGGPFADVARDRLVAGFEQKGPESQAGDFCGPRTFGHLGFTGTSVWLDPDAEAVVVVLTNRVHPTRENLAIRTARPIAHDALFGMAAARRRE